MEDNFNQEFEDDLFGANDPDVVEEEDLDSDDSIEEPSIQANDSDENDIDDSNESKSDSFLNRMLIERGIDKNKIRLLNEYGEIEEVKFDDLSEEDKYNILNDYLSPITDDELNTLNYLRKNKMDLQSFAEWQREQAVLEYLSQNNSVKYLIDDLNDDELFAYDLMTRFGDSITDEEIDNQLDRAKEDEEMFKKTVNLLRSQYKAREDELNAARINEENSRKTAEFNNFVDEMVSAALNVQTILGAIIEDEDREKILDFLLKDNPQGKTGFSELLSDPDMLFKMAWFALYGEDTFNATVDHFKLKLAEARRGDSPQKSKVVTKKATAKEPDYYGLNDVF